MSGNVWAANPTTARQSLLKMNHDAHTTSLDGYSQATPLAKFNVTPEIKRIHVDAIASNDIGSHVQSFPEIEKYFNHWNQTGSHGAVLTKMDPDQLQQFVTSPLAQGGLGLSPGNYEDAYHFATLNYGIGHNTDWNLF